MREDGTVAWEEGLGKEVSAKPEQELELCNKSETFVGSTTTTTANLLPTFSVSWGKLQSFTPGDLQQFRVDWDGEIFFHHRGNYPVSTTHG